MPSRIMRLIAPSFMCLVVTILVCLFGSSTRTAHADCQPHVAPTFTVTFPKVSNPPDPLNWNLPPVWGPLNSEVGLSDTITVPNGRPIYALIVSGYTRNRFFDELLAYHFARHLMDQGAYVHWAWWNNLLAPYMERPLHHSQSHPGSAADITSFTNPSAAELKAMPGENYQFLSDAKLFLQAIRQHNPEAVIILVGHSMGGHSIAQLANETNVLIDLVAPIDPVASRTYPWTVLDGQHHYNWTRYRATRASFNGYRSMTWDGGPFFGECVPTGPWRKSWGEASSNSTHPNCLGMVHVHGAPHMTFGSNIVNLHHRWQHEAKFPYDFHAVRLFNPNYPKPLGGTESQVAVATKASGLEAGGWPVAGGNECCPVGHGAAWPEDGHGEIVGARGPAPFLKPLGFQVRTSPECGILDPCSLGDDWPWPARTWAFVGGYTNGNVNGRVQLLKALETRAWPQDPSNDSWPHRPHNFELCLVSEDLVEKFESMNKPPVADAGGDQAIECDGCVFAVVTLNGSGSFDPNGFPLEYTWTGPFGTATGPVVNVHIPVGTHCVTLRVRDSVGHTVRDYATISVIDVSEPITPFISAAGPWQAQAVGHGSYAFDEYYPGLVVGGGCLLESPLEPTVLALAGGTMTVTAYENGGPYCAITDSSSALAASDGRINNQNSVLILEFEPPVTAFYTYFGSLAASHTATMSVYGQSGTLLGTITTLPSVDSVLASGMGFTASVPVQRIELTTTEPGSVMVGAFAGLLPNEQSLGTVNVPGYPAPGLVDFDFGVVFADACPADLTGDCVVDVSDLLILLGAWGVCRDPSNCPADLNGDGAVDVSDLLILLANWG